MFKILANHREPIVNHQMTKEVAKPSALNILKARSGSEQNKASDPWYRARIDPNEAAKNAKIYKNSYEKVLPETLSPQSQNEMWKKAKQLKDKFTVGMLSREELHPVKGFTDNGTMKVVVDEERMRTLRSTERELAWQRKNENNIKDFKNIMRHLNPDDPNAGDIEKFRPRNRTGSG